MSAPDIPGPLGEETEKDRLDGLLSSDVLTLDLVSAYAGDRLLTPAETKFLNDRKNNLDKKFYSELIYAITHQHFQTDVAETLWNKITRHKYEMSAALKRNTRIVVAALDYLSNISGDILSTTLISESQIADIVDGSLRDGLTGLFNHAFFYRRIDLELKKLTVQNAPVSLMMIDIDDFKEYNDRYGHQQGDTVLNIVGAIIKEETRDSDICCRYGGEEFGIILPSTDRHKAIQLAERLRNVIANHLLDDHTVTVSIGIATTERQPLHSAESLVKEADDALYEAKAGGKNRVSAKG